MKLIIPAFIILLGMLTGMAVCAFFKETAIGFKLSVIAGGLGAFAGLILRDVMDFTYGGDIVSSLLAAILGAAIFAAVTNRLFGQRGSPD